MLDVDALLKDYFHQTDQADVSGNFDVTEKNAAPEGNQRIYRIPSVSGVLGI